MQTKFRVLYRQFLFRLMDVELLSQSARGDASGLLGQIGALLIFGGLLQAYFALPIGAEVRRQASAAALWPVERVVISLTMLVVGVFALLSWDATFPDRRDVLVLGPLPIRARTLFTAKIAAAGAALGLTVACWNCLAGFAWPMTLAPAGSGFAIRLRFIAAFWVTLAAAGAFLYCMILGVQAVAAQLPRRWYLRMVSFLQIVLFALFLGITLFQPSINTAAALGAPENQSTLAWLPPYWFLGLLSELSGVFPAEGHAVMAPLAYRAVTGLLIAICAAGAAFLASYFRTLRKVVEAPDIAPASRWRLWLPNFGTAPQTAITQFIIRTLLRSSRHRTILAFYLGAGVAIVAVYLGGALQAMHLSWTQIIWQVRFPMLAVSILMLFASWLGTRIVFSLPLDLRSNWLFRVTPVPRCALRLSAVRRALLLSAVLPVCTVSAAFLFSFWPWAPAAEHLLLLWLLGTVLTDISLNGFRKIPFTCSYLPGKSKAHMVFWFGIIPLVFAIHKAGQLEYRAMADPLRYCELAVTLAAAALTARLLANTSANRSEQEVQFEEIPADKLVELGLNG